MDRQMNRHIDWEKDWTDIITYPHTWMVIKQECISVECKPPACWQYGLHKIGSDIDIFFDLDVTFTLMCDLDHINDL